MDSLQPGVDGNYHVHSGVSGAGPPMCRRRGQTWNPVKSRSEAHACYPGYLNSSHEGIGGGRNRRYHTGGQVADDKSQQCVASSISSEIPQSIPQVSWGLIKFTVEDFKDVGREAAHPDGCGLKYTLIPGPLHN